MYEEAIYRLLDGESDVLDGINSGNNIINAGSMGFSQAIQTELTPLLQNEDAFDVFTDCLTKPLDETGDGEVEATGKENDKEGKDDNEISIPGADGDATVRPKKSTLQIKRSFRTMTLIVNDTNSAQQLHKQLNAASTKNKRQHVDEDKLYEKFLMNPTRAVLLAKKIFASYDAIYQHFVDGERGEKFSEIDGSNNSLCDGSYSSLCRSKKAGAGTTTKNSTLLTLPHLPHLNKTLSALLAAFPKQVVLASCAGDKDCIKKNLEPMLLLQKYCPDFTSPIQTMIDLITMGCTGRKRETGNLQQQAMMNAGTDNGIDQILIACAHRKKFVRSLAQWGLVQKFVDMITQSGATESSGNSEKMKNEHAAENACDALLSIMEFICFPQQIHPAMAMNGNNNGISARSDSTTEESAGEEELLSPLARDEVIAQLTKCAYYVCDQHQIITDERNNSADASSRVLLGSFEIATGKARKNLMTPPLETVEEEDVGAIECKAQNKDPKDIPGIDDNKLLKAGVTSSMHSALVSNMELVVQAMDIYVKSPSGSSDDADGDVSESPSSSAVNHPGRYTIERPFTSRRLDIITLFADIVSYEDRKDDKVDRTAAVSALEALMTLPVPALKKGEEVDADSLLNPWPGLCDLLFDYPENSLYGVQFFRMLHALCMTNHEKTLKLVIQKCKFLSRAIKECKNQSSCSNRGVLLRCLNAMRLHSQSIGPNSFLKHYLDSHDGWKTFEDELRRCSDYLNFLFSLPDFSSFNTNQLMTNSP